MALVTRPVSWIKAARKEFEKFPKGAKQDILEALVLAAEGRKGEIAKPMKGLGPGVFEIALQYRTNAYRLVYALQIGTDIWVVHAFQKKSMTGSKTPKRDIDLIKQRIKTLKEMLI
ncbi:MAG: type II toxin-antitoxin system RelE/ParE family toxin [Nitrospinae bacterium]|nr:type II toxin-antitoxin system RelE/ParE family toxin [Nitrospinota bacterium]